MDIEHKELEMRMDGLEQTFNNRFDGLQDSLANLEYINNRTLEQALKTNGRVDRLERSQLETESDLTFIRAVRKRKWIIAIFILAFIKIYDVIDIEFIINKAMGLL
jgi:t-SNARE complex subunit (syntaxin)